MQVRVDGIGSLLHHGGQFWTLRYDRCGHESAVAASSRQVEQTVKAYDRECQQCARPLAWVCPGYALILTSNTITVDEDRATGDLMLCCASCGADAWG